MVGFWTYRVGCLGKLSEEAHKVLLVVCKTNDYSLEIMVLLCNDLLLTVVLILGAISLELRYKKYEVERIAKVAFELARKRNGHVTSVDKANVLDSSQFWRDVVHEVHKDYQDVPLSNMYVDNAAMQLVRDPKQFDVIVTQNLFGDILSDITAMITGSLGMLPSASIGEKHAMYEPVHGTAPEIAGQNKANPIAMICSVAMMMEITLNQPEAAHRLNNAIESVLENGIRTIDIASTDSTIVTTDGMRDEIIHAFQQADKSILHSRDLVRE